jgi:hypothetical protein
MLSCALPLQIAATCATVTQPPDRLKVPSCWLLVLSCSQGALVCIAETASVLPNCLHSSLFISHCSDGAILGHALQQDKQCSRAAVETVRE